MSKKLLLSNSKHRCRRLEDFRNAFCKAAIAHPAQPTGNQDLRLKLDPRDHLKTVLRDLELLEPCGEGNPRPQIVVEGTVLSAKDVKSHLSLEMDLGNKKILKGFRVCEGKLAATIVGQRVTVIGDLRPTSYGAVGVEMFIDRLLTQN